MSTDVNRAASPDNPLRQVIVNTHSPAVVANVPERSLLMADLNAANTVEIRAPDILRQYRINFETTPADNQEFS